MTGQASLDSGLKSICFPVLAVSPAGWHKLAAGIDDLMDASPSDPLDELQGLAVYDAAGRMHSATRAFRAWPKSRLGWLCCRLFNQSVHVGFEFAKPVLVELQELVAIAEATGEVSKGQQWASHEQLLRFLVE